MDDDKLVDRAWLLVEDEPSLRSMLTVTLRMWDVEPIIFADGYRAMQWLDRVSAGQKTCLPELALLDIRLPGPQGSEIAGRMRSIKRMSGLVVVLMTAYRFDVVELAHIEEIAQPDLILYKPLPDPLVLKEVLYQPLKCRRVGSRAFTTVDAYNHNS